MARESGGNWPASGPPSHAPTDGGDYRLVCPVPRMLCGEATWTGSRVCLTTVSEAPFPCPKEDERAQLGCLQPFPWHLPCLALFCFMQRFLGPPTVYSITQSSPTLCDPMNRSTPGLPVHHQLPEFTETSIESVMPSSHLILCRPLLLLPPIPPSIRVFSNESTLRENPAATRVNHVVPTSWYVVQCIRRLIGQCLYCSAADAGVWGPWTVARQAPLSMDFSRQEHWSGLPFPSPMHETEKLK